jgi:hypothetical protein
MGKMEFVVGERIPLFKGGLSQLVYLGESPKENTSYSRNLVVRCSCGKEFTCNMGNVRSGSTTRCRRCGDISAGKLKIRDLTGKVFGRWTVLGIDGRCPRGTSLTYTCRCSCGNVSKKVIGCNLTSGTSNSCGCYKRERISETHGTNWRPGDKVGPFTIVERLENSKNGKQRYKVVNNTTGKESCMSSSDMSRRILDIAYLRYVLRSRVKAALHRKGISKTKSAIKGLPWTVQDIADHIGPKLEGDYHLDHICPLSQALTENEMILLNNPINLRWIPGKENMSKGASWSREGHLLCLELLSRPWNDKKVGSNEEHHPE